MDAAVMLAILSRQEAISPTSLPHPSWAMSSVYFGPSMSGFNLDPGFPVRFVGKYENA